MTTETEQNSVFSLIAISWPLGSEEKLVFNRISKINYVT